jgi:hypothetical protein
MICYYSDLSGHYTNLAKVTNFRVTIGHYQLKRVMEYKYLGMFLDDSLTWKSHVDYITTKVGKRLGLLHRTRKDLTANAANMIYKTFNYCDSVWACCNRGESDQLERLQNRAGRIVMRSTRSAPALTRLNWDMTSYRIGEINISLNWLTYAWRRNRLSFYIIVLYTIKR